MPGVQILMPMGGLGSRFVKEGFTTPKPLITVNGKPMFMRALDSFSNIESTTNIFVIREDQVKAYQLDEQIKASLPDAKISVLDHDTGGAVETCLIATDDIDDDTPLIVADCDIYFESKDYFEKINNAANDGLLLTFESQDPRYSYVEVDQSGKAVRTAEKVVISSHAILGGYYFKSGKLFKELAKKFAGNPLPEGLKEYFISHLFNMMIEGSKTVAIADIDKKYIFGTPEELNEYLRGNN